VSRRGKKSAPEIDPPGDAYWERTAGFRESLLQLFPKREAKALRRVGRLMFDLVVEANLPDLDGPRDAALTRLEVESALMDLRAVQSHLASISLDVDDTRLAVAAGEAAGNLTPILGALAKVLQ
jgi:hypothetical protein